MRVRCKCVMVGFSSLSLKDAGKAGGTLHFKSPGVTVPGHRETNASEAVLSVVSVTRLPKKRSCPGPPSSVFPPTLPVTVVVFETKSPLSPPPFMRLLTRTA